MKFPVSFSLLSLGALFAGDAFAQITGPSTASTPYVRPTLPGYETISVLTVDNTGATADDVILKVGGGSYGLNGLPDGTGAFDNGDGTFTVLVNHEIGSTNGAMRAHGSTGAYVSKLIVSKSTLAVVAGEDLMKQVFGWNSALQQSNAAAAPFAFTRFCSADLPEPTAFFNAASGLGSSARIFLHGEESGATGWLQATVATGADAGKSYSLGKFNLATNQSGLAGIGGWENALANPLAQDKTVVVGTNDGGTGIMNNALAVYVGSKQATGSEVEKAGLMNGTLKFVRVNGSAFEITDNNTRATAITSGTPFVLSATTSTVFSRPEDGAWNPQNPNQFYFVTTDRFDQVGDGLGSLVGQTRLWRLNFADIKNPDLGGTIDLLIDGRTVNGEKVNMLDNIAVNAATGHLLLEEDVGGSPHNGKIWDYDPATDVLVKIAKHDPARFGDRSGGVSTAATAPYNNDEEASGIIDITPIMAASSMHRGNPREAWYISSDQAHYGTGTTSAQVEGGQIFVLHEIAPLNNVSVSRGGIVRDRRTGKYVQQVTLVNENVGTLTGPFHLVLDGLSAGATLSNSQGATAVYAPSNSPYATVFAGSLASGATATVTLQFDNPTGAAINYVARVLNSVATP
jgi:hypothetical protein